MPGAGNPVAKRPYCRSAQSSFAHVTPWHASGWRWTCQHHTRVRVQVHARARVREYTRSARPRLHLRGFGRLRGFRLLSHAKRFARERRGKGLPDAGKLTARRSLSLSPLRARRWPACCFGTSSPWLRGSGWRCGWPRHAHQARAVGTRASSPLGLWGPLAPVARQAFVAV